MLGKSITYVTAHCHYFNLNIFFLQVLALFANRSILSGLKKKRCLLKVSMTRKCQNRRLQTNQRYCEEETMNTLGLD